jgi:hypothetical protein
MDPVIFLFFSSSRRLAPLALTLALVGTVACSSSSTPTTPPVTTPPTTAAPTPTPPVAAGCPLGYGSGRYTCQGDTAGLLPNLDIAIDKLVEQKPQLFDQTNPDGTGGYLIYDVDAYYAGVVANLQAQGLCAQVTEDKEYILIKENNSYSESYDIVSAQQRIRRGPKTYVVTCTPANFPLTPQDAVATVAISFFAMSCPTGVIPPHFSLNKIPLGCMGTITATPRDAIGNKLPLDIHGPNIEWYFRDGENKTVEQSPDEGTPFNLHLWAKTEGSFSVCAVVQTKTGCLNGQVIP